jgi:hypothetical protein
MADSIRPDRDNATMARLRLALERELGAGETMLWHGWQLGRVDPQTFLIYVFAVPWTAFSVMWTVFAAGAVALSGDEALGIIGWVVPLFGLPFIAVGAWMLSRPFVPMFERGRVLYVVTDRRMLKLSLGRELVVQTAPADRIGLAERREQRDGTGMLKFAVRIGKDSDGDKQTEDFIIGTVADIMGAQEAINRINKFAAPSDDAAGALSS